MRNFCIFGMSSLLGWVGWGLTARFGMLTAYSVGSVGSLVGVYVGWRVYNEYLG